MRLADLRTGESGIVVKVAGRGAFRKRIIEMGFVKGKRVDVLLNAPLKDPIKYKIMDFEVSLRRSEAALIEVIHESEIPSVSDDAVLPEKAKIDTDELLHAYALQKGKKIRVALVGNPNAGKTSLFNAITGAHEHVGNYGGVTVDAKAQRFEHKGYTIQLVDLPGTYSLSSYTPEERYVRNYVQDNHPDVVINIVAASNLERNLYLTTQLIDMDARMVIALNMFDELEKSGDKFDYDLLGKMIGIPIVPTVSKYGRGIGELFDTVIDVYEERNPVIRHVHINYGEILEQGITQIQKMLHTCPDLGKNWSSRYLSIQLLEKDKDAEHFVKNLSIGDSVIDKRDEVCRQIEQLLQEDSESAFINARYGYIAGALKETYQVSKTEEEDTTRLLDAIVTHKVFGYPIFLLFMFVMFQATFQLGAYPLEAIEWAVAKLSEFVQNSMAPGALRDLITDGIIQGVGGVIVFLPNILILYCFISFMEDSGYMARAAFIMDKIMHKMGLHGKSFIPLVMGFGCNVPALMATRTIESHSSRMITLLVLPFMSCSARLPVYILLAGTFFPQNAGAVLFAVYATGVILSIITARLLRRFFFKEEEVPFVMELPPYRLPTWKSVAIHVWDRSRQYLRKMGGIILLASIVVWALEYFPREGDSFIVQLGNWLEPVMRPLGFNQNIGVSLLSGMAAKEVVVSTMEILNAVESLTPLTALSMMLFVLIYFPCIATVSAMHHETGSWKWTLLSVLYTTVLAWFVAFLVYQIGSFFV
ncbi:MAG: ferrous iron transport protein B [Bacteroidales bacterium]|nr:ferrous iron transport protein B [Bacteroidales bacterium]